MNIVSIARALGGAVAGPTKVLAPGLGHSRQDRSMSVLIDQRAPDGFVVTSFAGDDWKSCRDHVRSVLGIDYQRTRPGGAPGLPSAPPPAEPRRVEAAAAIWASSVPLVDTLAHAYLKARIKSLPDEALSGVALRFHPACSFRLQDGTAVRLPALIAVMTDIRTNEFRGIHRTALKPDGSGKSACPGLGSPKRMLGTARGACVKLSCDEQVTTGLHLAEGIETALACMSVGFAPVWAALSAGAIATFPVLSGIESVTVFADNDESGTGLTTARACATRWARGGADARIVLPPRLGRDWADIWGRHP